MKNFTITVPTDKNVSGQSGAFGSWLMLKNLTLDFSSKTNTAWFNGTTSANGVSLKSSLSVDATAMDQLAIQWIINRNLHREIIRDYEKDNAVIIWGKLDIRISCDDYDIPYSDELATQVLGYINTKHDASIGICWDNLPIYIKEIYKRDQAKYDQLHQKWAASQKPLEA